MYRGGDHPPPELPPGEHHGVQREEGGGDVTAVGQVAAAAQHLPPAPGDHYWECSEFSIISMGPQETMPTQYVVVLITSPLNLCWCRSNGLTLILNTSCC